MVQSRFSLKSFRFKAKFSIKVTRGLSAVRGFLGLGAAAAAVRKPVGNATLVRMCMYEAPLTQGGKTHVYDGEGVESGR